LNCPIAEAPEALYAEAMFYGLPRPVCVPKKLQKLHIVNLKQIFLVTPPDGLIIK
jgi:hypothetical protein